MPIARIYDAAGHTTDFLYETDEPELKSASASRLVLSAGILSGPQAGKTATIQWLGSFDLDRGVGSVREWRESIGNSLHFSLRLDAPVDLDDLFDGMEDAFAGGVEFHGNRFRNLLEGDRSHDRLFGNAGNDRLFGYQGNDLLDGGAGADRMAGGRGNDGYVVDNRGDLVIEAAGAGIDTVRSSISYTLPANVENLTLTGSANIDGTGNALANVIRGNAGGNVLTGGRGNDSLFGGGGNDRLVGGPGNDRLVGNAGNDVLVGGAGNDVLDGRHQSYDRMMGGPGDDVYFEFRGNAGEDSIVEKAREGYDTVKSFSQGYTLSKNVEELHMVGKYDNTVNASGNELANVIVGSSGRDFINGYGGNDRISGGRGDDMITGFRGNDILGGGPGDDQIWDFYGNNSLSGGQGNDRLSGGDGRDTLTGGSGADQFVFETVKAAGIGRTRDVITDFQTGIDKIVLEYIDANANRSGDQAFRFIGSAAFSEAAGELAYRNGVVLGDVDGDGVADFGIAIQNGAALAAGDFIL